MKQSISPLRSARGSLHRWSAASAVGGEMFSKMSGRQAAGWGYGIFWLGLLIETINTIHSAMLGSPLESPIFWIGTALMAGCTLYGIALLMSIRHRVW